VSRLANERGSGLLVQHLKPRADLMHHAINKNQQEAAGLMRKKGLAAGYGL
jgi:hypothetical protein